jgi:predicted DNA-binding antitoxin AbrB/MazE fold protein
VKANQEKRRNKPLKRVYQPPGCIVRAKIRRIKAHLQKYKNDRIASRRLEELERSLE